MFSHQTGAKNSDMCRDTRPDFGSDMCSAMYFDTCSAIKPATCSNTCSDIVSDITFYFFLSGSYTDILAGQSSDIMYECLASTLSPWHKRCTPFRQPIYLAYLVAFFLLARIVTVYHIL